MPGGRRPISSMVIVFLADLVMAAVLARLIPAMGPTTIASGWLTAGACWLGFVLTTIVVTNGESYRIRDARKATPPTDGRRP